MNLLLVLNLTEFSTYKRSYFKGCLPLEKTKIKLEKHNLRYKADWQTRAGIYSGGKKRPWIYASETIRELVANNISSSSSASNSGQSNPQTADPAAASGSLSSSAKGKLPATSLQTHASFFQPKSEGSSPPKWFICNSCFA